VRLVALSAILLAGCALVDTGSGNHVAIDTSPEWMERAAQEANNARLSEAASNLSRVAAGAIALGVIAFLFGHMLAIPRWVSASTMGLATLTATTAPQLLAFFGSESAQKIMLATFSLLALAGTASACVWFYKKMSEAIESNPNGKKEKK